MEFPVAFLAKFCFILIVCWLAGSSKAALLLCRVTQKLLMRNLSYDNDMSSQYNMIHNVSEIIVEALSLSLYVCLSVVSRCLYVCLSLYRLFVLFSSILFKLKHSSQPPQPPKYQHELSPLLSKKLGKWGGGRRLVSWNIKFASASEHLP